MALADARIALGVQRNIKQEHGSAKKYREVQKAEKVAALEASHSKTVADSYTVEKMCCEYIDIASRELKSWAAVDRIFKRNVIKVIGNRPARDVRRAEIIAEVLEPLNKRGKFTSANRTLAHFRRVYNWAINSGKFDAGPDIANPCSRIEMNKEHPRERALSDSEIRRLLAALPD